MMRMPLAAREMCQRLRLRLRQRQRQRLRLHLCQQQQGPRWSVLLKRRGKRRQT